MTTRLTEIWVGVFVAAGIAAFFMLAMKVSNLSSYSDDAGYTITARFEDISGLKARSPVTMAGVRIGRVSDIYFDNDSLEAVVMMRINGKHSKLPKDSSASIYTAGLLGEKYVGLEAGGDEKSFKQGDVVKITQDSLVLEKLISELVSKMIDGDKETK